MKTKKLINLILLLLIFIASCNSSQTRKGVEKLSSEPAAEIIDRSESPLVEDLPGKTVYETNCLACHQADASGVSGMFPPLNQADKVLGPSDELIKVVLFGLSGPVEVKGETYTEEMPAFDYLSNTEIADVLNYIKKTWGNPKPVISIVDVGRIRSAGKN